MTAEPTPREQRILALDLGQVRIGVAVSDLLGWTARPVAVIKARPTDKAVARIKEFVKQYEVRTVVIGMPYNMDGTEGPQAAWTRRFGQRLARAIKGVTIVYEDERLTTVESDSLLMESGVKSRKRKERRDKIAAALILQSYLESQRSRPKK